MKNSILILLFSALFLLSCEDTLPAIKGNSTLKVINQTSCDFNIIMFNTNKGISSSNSIGSFEIDLKGAYERDNTRFTIEPRDSCSSHPVVGIYEFDLRHGETHIMLID